MDNQMDHDDVHSHARQSFSVLTHDMMSQIDGKDSEDDNEIELELTAEYMANGYSDMETEDYTAAEENFRSALELAEEHDFSDRLDYGPGDITLVLADCLTRQDKEEEAMELLEPIADGSAHRAYSDVVSVQAGNIRDTGRDQITQLKACHTLALIFLKRADTHAAEKRAQQAFKGRRKVCGPHDLTTLDSVQLLIDIYTTKNDKTKARAYRRFLEPSTKGRTGVATLTKISAAPPVLPPVFQPTTTATLTEPAPTTLEKVEAEILTADISEEDPPKQSPHSLPVAAISSPSSTSISKLSSSSTRLARIAEDENASKVPGALEEQDDQPALQLSDSIRAALLAASTSSTLPSSPMVIANPENVSPPLSSTFAHSRESMTVGMPEPVFFEGYKEQIEISAPASIALPASPQNSISKAERSSPSAHSTTSTSKSTRSLARSDSTVTLLLPTTQTPAAIPEYKPVTWLPHLPNTSQPVDTVAEQTYKITTSGVGDTVSRFSLSSIDAGAVKAQSPDDGSNPSMKTPSPRRKAVPSRYANTGASSASSMTPIVHATPEILPPRDSEWQSATRAQSTAARTSSQALPISATRPSSVATSATTTFPDDSSSTKLPASVLNSFPVAPSDRQSLPSVPISGTTSSPPTGTMSASQAAFASIFASSGGKPPKKSSSTTRIDPSPTVSKNADTLLAPMPSRKLSSLSQETLTALPLTRETPSTQRTDEAAMSIESSEQENTTQQGGNLMHLRGFSWLPDAKLSMPSSIARVMSSSAAPGQSDEIPGRALSSATVKRKAWPLSLSKNRTDAYGKNEATPPPPSVSAISVAGSETHSRRNSVSTLDSNVEPKRNISFTTVGLTSQPLRLLNKEFGLGIDRLSRPSFSRPHNPAVQSTPRTRHELAPRFVSIKTLRVEGKKSVSIDAAIRLLREYDVERRILGIRESEIKKNMRESDKGLASTGYGYAPIHFFCEQRTEAALEVELLIEQGVDVNAVAYESTSLGQPPFTPLQRAVENGHVEIVRLLVDADVAIAPPRLENGTVTTGFSDPITHPLLLACTKGQTEMTKIMLNGGAARLLKEFPHSQWHGNSLLHEACWLGDTKTIKMLLDQLLVARSQYHPSAGPDYESGVIGAPGQQDRFGATPMMYAVDLRDCSSQHMRLQKSLRRKECLKLLLEHDIHGDLHSSEYRDNIARVLSTKWTRGPGKGHSIFCYCDEAGDDDLIRLLDPFRYQVSPSARCHATPQCSPNTGTSVRTGSINSGSIDRQPRLPEFPELMSVPVSWPVSANATQDGEQYELASNFDSSLPEFEHLHAGADGIVTNGNGGEEPLSPVTARSNSNGHRDGIKESLSQFSEPSTRSSVQVV